MPTRFAASFISFMASRLMFHISTTPHANTGMTMAMKPIKTFWTILIAALWTAQSTVLFPVCGISMFEGIIRSYNETHPIPRIFPDY